MLQAKGKIVVLQEVIRHARADGLIHDAVLNFADNKIVVEALGIEDKQGVVDATLTVRVEYPLEISSPTEVSIGDLGDLLNKLELFERNDEVKIYTTADNKFVVDREVPKQILTYDLADKKYVKSYPTGDKVVSWNPVTLKRSDGKEKVLKFDASISIEANVLREYGKVVSEIKPLYTPIQIRDGKLITALKGETTSLLREVPAMVEKTKVGEVETVKILSSGTATSMFDKELHNLIKLAYGVATIRIGEMSLGHIHYELKGMKSDYLIQKYEEK